MFICLYVYMFICLYVYMFICLEEGRCQLVVIYYASDTTEYG